MSGLFKQLGKMTMGYGMVQWAGPFLSLIFTPIITRVLSPADYGIADYIITISSFIGVVTLCGLPQAITAHFNDQQDPAWQRRLVGSGLTLALSFAIVASIGLFTLSPTIAQFSFGNQDHTHLLYLISITFSLGTSGVILTTASQSALRIRWGMVFSLATILCTIVGNLIFIVALRLGAMGLLLTPIVNGITISIIALILARSLIGLPSPKLMQMLFLSGALILPSIVSTLSLQMIDRLFLVRYVSPEDLGYYAIANKISGLLYVVILPIFSSWTPLALSMQHDPNVKEYYATISRYFVAIALYAALALGLFATEILLFLTRPAYLPAAPYVGILAYVQVFSSIGTLLYTTTLASKQFKVSSWLVVAGAGVNLILNFLLIPQYHVWGATIATIIGVALPQILLYIWLQRKFPIPYPITQLLLALLIQFILLMLGYLIPPLALPLRIGIKFILLTLLPLSFVALGIITLSEIKQAKSFIYRRFI